MTEVKCSNCGKLFRFELVGIVYPGGKDREEARCPYCGEVAETRMTSQSYIVERIENGTQNSV